MTIYCWGCWGHLRRCWLMLDRIRRQRCPEKWMISCTAWVWTVSPASWQRVSDLNFHLIQPWIGTLMLANAIIFCINRYIYGICLLTSINQLSFFFGGVGVVISYLTLDEIMMNRWHSSVPSRFGPRVAVDLRDLRGLRGHGGAVGERPSGANRPRWHGAGRERGTLLGELATVGPFRGWDAWSGHSGYPLVI